MSNYYKLSNINAAPIAPDAQPEAQNNNEASVQHDAQIKKIDIEILGLNKKREALNRQVTMLQQEILRIPVQISALNAQRVSMRSTP